MKLSIVFSFRNEEESLPLLLDRVATSIKDIVFKEVIEYEMIFVNDASTDNSKNILTALAYKYPIKIINMARRFGVGPCVLAGFEYSTGDAVIYMDSDLQDPPELIPELFKQYINGADVVHTKRVTRKGENPIKMLLTKCAYKAIAKISSIEVLENVGDFKLISKRALAQILKIKDYDPYMRGLSAWVGFKQVIIEYEREARVAGVGHFSLFGKGPFLEFIRGVTAFSSAPLYFGLLLGSFVTIISIGMAIFAIVIKILGVSAPGSSSIIVTISFFAGTQILILGILGIYISKIFNQVRGYPRYIVESFEAFDENRK